jgi:hypothetical protein
MNQSPVRIDWSNVPQATNREAIMRGVLMAVGFIFSMWFMGFWAWQAYELRRIANHFETFKVDISDTLPYFEDKKK